MSSVLFNNYDLDSIAGLEVYGYEFNQYPQRDIHNFKLAAQHRSAVTTADFVDKEVVVHALIKNCTREDAEAILVLWRQKTREKSKELQVNQYDRTVNYTATVSRETIKWVGNNMKIDTSFYCEEPIGVDDTIETQTPTTITTTPVTRSLTFNGSHIEQLPRITLTVVSRSGTGEREMFIGNNDTEVILQLTRPITAGDVIVVNCRTKVVTVNGVEVEYAGGVPVFSPGSNSLYYSDTLTARNITVSVAYERRYI